MPELPEVEIIRIGLRRLLPGKVIVSETHDWPKGFPNSSEDIQEFLLGAEIREVRRRAKVLLIELDTKYSLVIHLKMTGQLVFVGRQQKPRIGNRESESRSNSENRDQKGFELPISDLGFAEYGEVRFGAGHPNDSLVGRLPDGSTRVILTFADGSQLFFNDQRKFGWMRLLPTDEVSNIDFFRKVGPEPLADDFRADSFRERIGRRANSTVKAALLDQSVLAGIGNIYADESLWSARIHPARRVKDVSDAKLNNLFTAIREVLRLAVDSGGSSDRNYVDAEGRRGSYLSFAKVFRREGKPCFRHPDTKIIKIRVAGRGTHICPRCQRLP